MIYNTDYQNIIDRINRIRGYGLSKLITIPQIAILGDQSSGKSSVLEAITKLTFPRNIETCTRFATQVSIRYSDTPQMFAYIEGESQFNKNHQALSDTYDVHKLVTAANEILCANSEISEKVLEITISGPTLTPLTIIDLPGYINTTVDGQDKSIVQTIRTINTRYIKDSRTIILAVIPANVDLNNIFVLGEAEKYDSKNERTIPIVTKPDTIEPDLLPSLIQTITNKRKFMKLGYLVMRNSSFKDIDLPWEESRRLEEEFFKSSPLWEQVPNMNKGRVSVKNFLGDLLYSHIKKELPSLKKEVLDLIQVHEKEIADLGPPILSTEAAKMKYFNSVFELKTVLINLLDGTYTTSYIIQHMSDLHNQTEIMTTNSKYDDSEDDDSGDDDGPITLELEGDYQFIRSSLYRHYQRYNVVMNKDKYLLPKEEISKLVLRYKGNELPGFISFTIFTRIYLDTLIWWNSITTQHVHNMHEFLYKCVSQFISNAADPLLKDVFLFELDKFYHSQVIKIDSEIKNIFKDEGIPFTMNKYYYDDILNARKAEKEGGLQKAMDGFSFPYHHNITQDQVKNSMKQTLTSFANTVRLSDANYNEELALKDLQEKLKSYCKVARKRIVDIVLLQTIERHIIKSMDIYFEALIAVDDNVLSQLIEPPARQARRKELDEKIEILRKSLHEL